MYVILCDNNLNIIYKYNAPSQCQFPSHIVSHITSSTNINGYGSGSGYVNNVNNGYNGNNGYNMNGNGMKVIAGFS